MRLPPPPRIPGNPGLEVWTRRLTQRLEQSVRADILWRSGDSPDPRWEFTSTIIAGYSDATTVQVELDCQTGKILAGAGAVILDANGVGIATDASAFYTNKALTFVDITNSNSVVSWMANYGNVAVGTLYLVANHNGSSALSSTGTLWCEAQAAATYVAHAYLASSAGNTASLEVSSLSNNDTSCYAKITVKDIERFHIEAGQNPWIKDAAGNQIPFFTGSAIADADGTLSHATSRINAMLDRLRNHYIIAT